MVQTQRDFNLPEKNLSLELREDTITTLRNAAFDLSILDSVDDMPFPYTSLYGVHPMGVLYAVRKAHKASSNLSDQEARFSPTVLSRIRFKPRFDTSTCPLVYGIRGGETVRDSILKHGTFVKLVIEKRAIRDQLMIPRGATNREEESFQKFNRNSASLVGSTFASTHFDK
ncbi:hypothetical protein Tco_0287440 [Tanacetum coccineum]